MKGVKHYKRDGSLFKGNTHKMPNGDLHSGKTHGKTSVKLFHFSELSKTAKSKAKKGAKKLVGTKDFSTFRASSCRAKSPVKTMKSVKIKSSRNKIEIEFKSQSFLQRQVRSMVGCLKYLGEKKWTLNKFESVMKSKKRILCAPPAPPEGLFLARVIY